MDTDAAAAGLRIYDKANLLGARHREYPGGPPQEWPKKAPDPMWATEQS